MVNSKPRHAFKVNLPGNLPLGSERSSKAFFMASLAKRTSKSCLVHLDSSISSLLALDDY